MAQAANLDKAKKLAAEKAAALVESGMKVGLGSGSTAVHLVERLGVLARDEGLKIDCAATSSRSASRRSRYRSSENLSLTRARALDTEGEQTQAAAELLAKIRESTNN